MPQYLADINGSNFILSEEETRHIKVARIKAGERFKIFDGKGNKYLAVLNDCAGRQACGVIENSLPCVLPKRQITLCFCAISRPATEDLLDKCTQAGVFAFQPVFSARSDADLLKKWETKQERWHQIVTAAAKQCETPLIPQILAPLNFADAVKQYNKGLICYEDEHQTAISTALASFTQNEPLAIFIGPEGGLTQDEVALAKKAGLACVSLGTNILRAETAATAACWAALQ